MSHDALARGLSPVIVSAPFGNYLRPSGTTPTLGTFTLARRGGLPNRLWRIAKTVRYYRKLGAWVNRIGLRNPGMGYLERAVAAGKKDVSAAVVSVHGFEDGEWPRLVRRAAALRPLAIELNLSCPNVGAVGPALRWVQEAVGHGVPLIAKLPPVRYEAMAERLLESGVRAFHACNTLPSPGGGMSGRPLQPLSLQCVGWLRKRWTGLGEPVLLVGGGGVYDADDVDRFADAGADRVAIGTKLMHPKYLWSDRGIVAIRSRAEARFGGGEPG
ncbi:MAG: hypothetical protein AAF612_01735 [Planctomycetota bacterium]